MTSTSEPIVFLCSHAGWSGDDALACLEALMTTAVFDTPARLVLHDAGVLQLIRHQDGSALGMKTLSRMHGALGLYGIEVIHVLDSSLQQFGLTAEDLLQDDDMDAPLAIRVIDKHELAATLAASQAVFSF